MFSLAWKNIIRRLGGSLMTALIAFIAVFVLATSLAVVASLENGLRLSRERLGADIMVLPAGASGNASEVLFCAEPVNVYLPADVERTVAGIDGVEQATPQFFTQTVNQSCCSVIGVTRVVGIDMETDFIVGPWLVGGALEGGALPPDGIILGAAAPPIEGGQASILGSVFHCVGTLEPTGSSVDETIFMDVNAARTIAAESPYLESVWLNVDPFDAISCVMVKVKEGAQPSAVAAAIIEQVPGAAAVCTSDLIAGVTSQLVVLESMTLAFLAAIVLLAALALAGRFSSLVSSRMGELGLLRTMGVGRLKVALSFVVEVGVVTMAAAAAATACACLASSAIIGQLHTSFDLPGALLAPSAYGWVVCAALLFAVLLSLVALVQPMIALMRQDPQETLAKGGL